MTAPTPEPDEGSSQGALADPDRRGLPVILERVRASLADEAAVVAAVVARVGGTSAEDSPAGERDPDAIARAVHSIMAVLLDGLHRSDSMWADPGAVDAILTTAHDFERAAPTSLGEVVRAASCVVRHHLFEAAATTLGGSALAELERAVGRLHDVESGLLSALDGVTSTAGDGVAFEHHALLRRLLERRFDVALATRARRLGIELRPPLWVVLLLGGRGDDERGAAERIRACARALPVPTLGPVLFDDRAPQPDMGVVVASPRDDGVVLASLTDACKRLDCVAVYATAASPSGLAGAFEAARPLAPVAWRCARRLGAVFDLDAAWPYLFANGLPAATQTRLVRSLVGPLMRREHAPHAPDRIDTLRAYYAANGATKEAARAVHVGPQGARTRLRKIAELTGFDIRTDRLAFEVAVTLYDLYADEWAPPGDPWWDGDDS